MITSKTPRNEVGNNLLEPHPEPKPNKALEQFQRLTSRLIRRDQNAFQPLKDHPISPAEKTSPPKKLGGICVLRRDGKFQISRKYYTKASKGRLTFYKCRNGSTEKDTLTPEYNINLAKISEILYNDDAKKLVLCLPRGQYHLQPIAKEKYEKWKIALQQHRAFGKAEKENRSTGQNKAQESTQTAKSNSISLKQSEKELQNLLQDLNESFKLSRKNNSFDDFEEKLVKTMTNFSQFVEQTYEFQLKSTELLTVIEKQAKECREMILILRSGQKYSDGEEWDVTTAISATQSFSELPVQATPPKTPKERVVVKPLPSILEVRVHPAFQPLQNPRKALPAEPIFGGSIPLSAIFRAALPVHAFEPLGDLQVLVESMSYAGQCLNKIHRIKDPVDRMCMVAAMAVSFSCITCRKNRRPFGAALGETFDFISPDGWKAHAEQVYNQTSAMHAQGEGWELYKTIQLAFFPTLTGSLRIVPQNPIKLRVFGSDEFAWNPIPIICHNARAEADKRVVKTAGDILITSTSGVQCKMTFSEEKNAIRGEVIHNGKVVYKLVGYADKGLNRLAPGKPQERLLEVKKPDKDIYKFYHMNPLSITFNQLDDQIRPYIPKTDTRLREDIRLMEQGHFDLVENSTKKIDETHNYRAANHRALWFEPLTDLATGKTLWYTNGRYWQAKSKKFEDWYSKSYIIPLKPDS
ncbi:unnamed protein product [Bursaphelenchus xylophilus]|uniref:(pine wood nematode) hypothetical protein n=1 Tax=Bursaphelenchus xylophilus TaxID=6326 RepID=A0A1I7RMP1_BURXY|nr:unnamed protein product [Bursaphelenchus xylophilus]CAG9125623.1 unnamed protein product [Bursaphelenchus xylophilus]